MFAILLHLDLLHCHVTWVLLESDARLSNRNPYSIVSVNQKLKYEAVSTQWTIKKNYKQSFKVPSTEVYL